MLVSAMGARRSRACAKSVRDETAPRGAKLDGTGSILNVSRKTIGQAHGLPQLSAFLSGVARAHDGMNLDAGSN